MSACDCHPGTEENGWQETRSERCRAAELAEWERTMSARRQAVLTELRKLDDGTHPVTLLTGIENLDELGGADE